LRAFQDILQTDALISVLQPNGSAKSIIDWSSKTQLDPEQRRAFEIITGTFVLSFFYTAATNTDDRRNLRHSFVTEKRRLRLLVDQQQRNSKQLICFLHGPAGSGKTAVINLTVAYCRSYCMLLSEGLRNHNRAVIITAMTGVAATLLCGETTHSAVYLNQKKPISSEQVELWLNTRLLIIDEISFASKNEIQLLHKQLNQLKQQMHVKFGGINIVFVGDMRQLEPVGSFKKPIYADDVPEFKTWINSYIELQNIHRFKDDPEWGALLLRFRNGDVTTSDIETINQRVVTSETRLSDDI
jgi:hypothetical protein